MHTRGNDSKTMWGLLKLTPITWQSFVITLSVIHRETFTVDEEQHEVILEEIKSKILHQAQHFTAQVCVKGISPLIPSTRTLNLCLITIRIGLVCVCVHACLCVCVHVYMYVTHIFYCIRLIFCKLMAICEIKNHMRRNIRNNWSCIYIYAVCAVWEQASHNHHEKPPKKIVDWPSFACMFSWNKVPTNIRHIRYHNSVLF